MTAASRVAQKQVAGLLELNERLAKVEQQLTAIQAQLTKLATQISAKEQA